MFTKESNTLILLKALEENRRLDILDALVLLQVTKQNLYSVIQSLNYHLGGKCIIIVNYMIIMRPVYLNNLGVYKRNKKYSLISNDNNIYNMPIDYPYNVYKEGFIYRMIYNLFGIN